LLNQVGDRLSALAPPDARRTAMQQSAMQQLQKVVEMRWVLA
jgi:hypothetical protein